MTVRLRTVPLEVAASTVVVCASTVAFVILAGLRIRLPGLYYDELFQDTSALAFVKGGLGSDVAWVPGTELSLFGHPLPLMAHNYIGAVKTIAFIPVAAVFGLSAESVRWFTVAVAGVALLAYARFATILFARGAVAAIATGLLATDPSFVFYSRIDLGPSVFMFLLKGVALWQLASWWRTGRTRELMLGFLALGLGVYDKANFAWIVAAIALAAVLVKGRDALRRLDRRTILIGAGSFLVGSLPLIVYNLSWPPRTLEPALSGTLHLEGGNDKGGPISQLFERFRQLADLLDGTTIADLLAQIQALPPLLPLLALISAVGVGLIAWQRPRGAGTAPALFVVGSGVFVLVAAALTPGGSYPHHVLLAYPFPHLAIAAFAVLVYDRVHGRWRPFAFATIAVALAAAVGVNVGTNAKIVSRLSKTGGHRNFSDASYRLSAYLQRDVDAPFVAVDWGIFQNLVALSEGRLRGDELWLELNREAPDKERYVERVTDPHNRYVLHTPAATNFPRSRANFLEIVRMSGHSARLVKTFWTRDGLPVLEIYRVD